MNYGFQIEIWLDKVTLEAGPLGYSGKIVTGPFDVCNNELLRRELQQQYDWGPPEPMDIFVMADGEPADRYVTKIGGSPYRPASAPWPINASGQPLLFIGQINFTDSEDLVGELPGDLLLVFADDILGESEAGTQLRFEWQPRQLDDLIAAEAVPPHPNAFNPCYGYIYRTVSYPDAEQIDDTQKYVQCRGKDVHQDYLLRQWQAIQIGAEPYCVQGGPWWQDGTPLCTISSVQPQKHKPFPWVNHPAPLFPEGVWGHDTHLMLDDMGCIYISIDEEQNLHWCMEGY